MKKAIGFAASVLTLVIVFGCVRDYSRMYAQKVTEVKQPDGHIDVVVTDGGWNVTRHKFGLDTTLNDVNLDVKTPTNSFHFGANTVSETVSSNDQIIVKEMWSGLAQNLSAATALVNSIEGGGVSSATGSLLNSLLTNAKTFLANGQTNEASIALSELQTVLNGLKSSQGAASCVCVTNSDGSVTCPSGECSLPAK